MQVPDAIEPAVGYRVWKVIEGRLFSVVHSTMWQPGMQFEAVCTRHPDEHDPPVPSCSCGTYAAATFNRLFDMGYTKDGGLFSGRPDDIVIAGTVSLWGRIIPGQHGWRAQFAYPKKLLIPHHDWRNAKPIQLSQDYDVPFELFNTVRKH